MRIFMTVFIVAGSFLALTKTHADDLPDMSNMSIEEIEELPSEILTKLPASDVFAKFAEEKQLPSSFFDTAIAINLSRLLFIEPSEEQKHQAIKDFQTSIGDKADGVLTLAQFEELGRRATRSTDTPVYPFTFGENISVYIDANFAVAEGTWIIEGEKIAYPINHSRISCEKSTGICEIVQVDVSIPSLDENSDSYSLHLSTQDYEVISWTKDEVVSQSVGKCRKVLMTMSKSSGEVFQITRNFGKEGCDIGGLLSLPKLETPQIAKLVGGFDTAQKFWQERKKEISKFYGKNFVEKLKLDQPTDSLKPPAQKN